ncbi:MAG: phosphatidate cytidylyltransferase [Chlorobi bacterium]|nr:phosphatidate cytidylyltransferase [Chlorobiota bacterium]
MKNLFTRAFSGAIYVILILVSIFWGPMAFAFLLFGFLVLSLREFMLLAKEGGNKLSGPLIYFIGIASFGLVTLFSFGYAPLKFLVIIVPLVFLLFIVELYGKLKTPIQNISYSILALVYIVLPLSLMNFFFVKLDGDENYHKGLILAFFVIIWVNDTFAYLSGMLLGRHKLFKSISPNKTWQGTIGGAAFSLIAAWIFSIYFPWLGLTSWLAFASVLIIFGTFGDLIESMFKRRLGVKDSGDIMPGHGGILDRLDSLLIAAPFVFVFIILVIK